MVPWTLHSLPKDGEASVAREMAQLELVGRGRLARRMASLGPPFTQLLEQGSGCDRRTQ